VIEGMRSRWVTPLALSDHFTAHRVTVRVLVAGV
jgi:hypothetical protein